MVRSGYESRPFTPIHRPNLRQSAFHNLHQGPGPHTHGATQGFAVFIFNDATMIVVCCSQAEHSSDNVVGCVALACLDISGVS